MHQHIVNPTRLGWARAYLLAEASAVAPRQAGIYLLCDADRHLLYVGKTHDLASRLARHLRKLEHDEYVWHVRPETVWCRWTVVTVSGPLGGLEQWFKRRLKPRYTHINSRAKRAERRVNRRLVDDLGLADRRPTPFDHAPTEKVEP